jgi:hypothetical protein
MIWKEVVVGLLKAFSQNMPGRAEENNGKCQSV